MEVTSDNLRFDENVAICRESDFASDSRIGRGKTSRIAAAAVSGVAEYEGSVLAIHVSEGDRVQRGQLMAETVTGALPQISANPGNVTAKTSGVIASVNVAPGDTVNLDQVLATVHPSGSYQVAADINEVDLMSVSIGDSVSLELLSLPDMKGVRGTIASISAVSSTTTGDAEYTLYIDFDANAQIREGMTVTVNLY